MNNNFIELMKLSILSLLLLGAILSLQIDDYPASFVNTESINLTSRREEGLFSEFYKGKKRNL